MSVSDPSFVVSLLVNLEIKCGNFELTVFFQSGGAAGTAVDIALFPLDTLKTRLQSQAGFWKSGGLRGIYAGVGPAALGSAPNGKIMSFMWKFKSFSFMPYKLIYLEDI